MTLARGRGSASEARGARFLDPGVLQRIGNLELVAQGVVEGFLHGVHASPHVGQSLDFAEHRQYVPGDDPRRVDWRVLARTDRFYLKEFEAETHANVTVILDRSRSMAFGSQEISKLDYARFLAASLAYLARLQGDRIGAVTFDSSVRDFVPCSARHLDRVLVALDRSEAEVAGELPTALTAMAERPRPRGILVLVSDLYLEPEELRRPISLLRAAGNDVLVFQVLDPAEIAFPYEEALTVEDLETGERLPITPDRMREEYGELMKDHVEGVGRVLSRSGADHVLMDTSRPLDLALARYLSARRHRGRRGRWASPS